MVGCKFGANAIRLHDEVVAVVAKLFRSLRLDVAVEPMGLFVDLHEKDSNQRPDIFTRNPRCFGRQVAQLCDDEGKKDGDICCKGHRSWGMGLFSIF